MSRGKKNGSALFCPDYKSLKQIFRKKKRVENLYYLISSLIIKLQYIRGGGVGKMIDTRSKEQNKK